VTSYKELYVDAIETERWNRLNPGEKPRVPYVSRCLADAPGRPGGGFGLFEDSAKHDCQVDAAQIGGAGYGWFRAAAKGARHCVISSKWMRSFIVLAALHELSADGKIDAKGRGSGDRGLGDCEEQTESCGFVTWRGLCLDNAVTSTKTKIRHPRKQGRSSAAPLREPECPA